jgi:hypothetical protein
MPFSDTRFFLKSVPQSLHRSAQHLRELQSNFNYLREPDFDLSAAPFNAAKSSSPANGEGHLPIR